MASRKNSEPPSPASRRAAQGEDVRTLRLRARHRLIGALALVLAVSIVLPMLVGDEPIEPVPIPDVLPVIPPVPAEVNGQAQTAPQTAPFTVRPPARQSPLPAPEPVPVQAPPAVAVPATPPRPTTANNPRAQNTRSDDGALALSLLEGQTAAQAAAPTQSSAQTPARPRTQFALQVMALGSESAAQQQRSKLLAAGVSNVYVQAATVNGKPTWRLRVGPFPTQQAAQAAQTSLRTLGYANSNVVAQ